MVHEVILPRLGTNLEEGVIQEWVKREGDEVRKGEPIALVETSKAIFELEAEATGVLRKILARKGERTPFNRPVAILTDTLDEDIDERLGELAAAAPVQKTHYQAKREGIFTAAAEAGSALTAATPAARRLSAELNIDLAAVAAVAGAGVLDELAIADYARRSRMAVYGAGLGAKQAREIFRSMDEVFVVGLFDDKAELKGRDVLGLKVLGAWDELVAAVSRKEVDSVVVSLHSEYRRKVIERLRSELPSVALPPLVDRRAVVSEGVQISDGVFIEAGSVIGPDTFIGEGVIVDMGAVVSHDCHIGEHCHLSPGCTLSGIVRLEANVLVGAGACVNSQVTIGRNVVITPGSAVVSDLPADVVVSGNPARIIGTSFRGA